MTSLLLAAAMTLSQPTDSTWETVINVWAYDVTNEQARMINEFGMDADSIWTEVDADGWSGVWATNAAFDTVIVHEISPEGEVGYQMLYWTETK